MLLALDGVDSCSLRARGGRRIRAGTRAAGRRDSRGVVEAHHGPCPPVQAVAVAQGASWPSVSRRARGEPRGARYARGRHGGGNLLLPGLFDGHSHISRALTLCRLGQRLDTAGRQRRHSIAGASARDPGQARRHGGGAAPGEWILAWAMIRMASPRIVMSCVRTDVAFRQPGDVAARVRTRRCSIPRTAVGRN